MRNPFITIILLLSCFCTFAQDFSSMTFKEARSYYQTASEPERNRLNEQAKNTEKVFREQQILEVAGIPFGISVEEALPMIEKVFGTTCVKVDNQIYSVHDIMYEGQFFDHAMFVFQSDILDHTWLCQAVFMMAAETQTQALSHQQMLREQFGKKYVVSKTRNNQGEEVYCGGISPLWDGHWYNLEDKLMLAFVIDTVRFYGEAVEAYGTEHVTRIIYGPYNYLDDDF